MWHASQYGEGRHLRQISFFWFHCFAYFARDFVRSNLSAFVRSSPCTMPNIGGGVERTSAELRLRRPGRRFTVLECSRRLSHGYSWSRELHLRAATPLKLFCQYTHNHLFVFRLLSHLPTGTLWATSRSPLLLFAICPRRLPHRSTTGFAAMGSVARLMSTLFVRYKPRQCLGVPIPTSGFVSLLRCSATVGVVNR